MKNLIHKFKTEKISERVTAFGYATDTDEERDADREFELNWDLLQNMEAEDIFLVPMILRYRGHVKSDFQLIIESEYKFKDFENASEEGQREHLFEALSMSVSYLRHMTSILTQPIEDGPVYLPMINIPELLTLRGLDLKEETVKKKRPRRKAEK